jgi:uncharacterized protein YkwD
MTRQPRADRRALTLAALALLTTIAGCGADDVVDPPQQRTVTVEIGRPSQADAGDGAANEPTPDRGGAPSVPGDDACPGADDSPRSADLRQVEVTTRCLINAVREEKGRSVLGFDRRLARAAATRSADMVEQQYFSHVSPDGQDVVSAVRGTGYIPGRRSWQLGENIGWGPERKGTPADLMHGWLNSAKHRANILSGDFTEVGVGVVRGAPSKSGSGGATYTTIFGARGGHARGESQGT